MDACGHVRPLLDSAAWSPGNYWVVANTSLDYTSRSSTMTFPVPDYYCSFAKGDARSRDGWHGDDRHRLCALTKGGRIAGVVRDAATGAPVADAFVWILDSAGTSGHRHMGGRRGRIHQRLPAARDLLRADLERRGLHRRALRRHPLSGLVVLRHFGDADRRGGGSDRRSGVDFALARGGSIAGRITSAGSGMPIAGAIVGIYDSAGSISAGRTPAMGRAVTGSEQACPRAPTARGPRTRADSSTSCSTTFPARVVPAPCRRARPSSLPRASRRAASTSP